MNCFVFIFLIVLLIVLILIVGHRPRPVTMLGNGEQMCEKKTEAVLTTQAHLGISCARMGWTSVEHCGSM